MIDQLLPNPRHLTIDDETVTLDADRLTSNVIAGTDENSTAWAVFAPEHPAGLPDEGYLLKIDPAGQHPVAIAAASEVGLFRARARLNQLADAGNPVPAITIRDWPHLACRGVVEGFYGAPWSHTERLDFLRFAARVGLNEYMYAPKDDPYHRERWREPYPQDALDEIAELAREAAERHVRFVYTIAPALSMRFAEDAEHETLATKAEQLWHAGVRSFALLFDDVPTELTDPGDIERFGSDARATGIAHGYACARFLDDFLRPHEVGEPLKMCPTDYAGRAPSAYRDGLQTTLPRDALVMWTGSDIVVGEVTRDDIDAAANSYGRRLLLWDNFPVNDFDRSRLFLGPLRGRTTNLDGSALSGISSNPMVEAAPSRFALASAADWAWNPHDYDPDDSARRAIVAVAGAHAHPVTALVAACSAWPPSAPQSAEFEQLVDDALDGDDDALEGLEAALDALAAVGGHGPDRHAPLDVALQQALEPWVAAARDAATAAGRACVLLRHTGQETAEALAAERQRVRAAQDRAESHYPNVLRSVLPRFVFEVLARAGEENVALPSHRRVAVLVGPNPLPGDRDLSERLTARGFDVDLVHDAVVAGSLETDLLIVTPGASAAAAAAVAGAPLPLLAWGRHDTLGLSTSSGAVLGQETIDVVGTDDEITAGMRGPVRVYRGFGAVSWCAPGADAAVLATLTTDDRAVIARYRTGQKLPNGGTAAADRVTFFLSTDGLAPWLIAPEGHALFMAAVDSLAGTHESAAATVAEREATASR